MRFSTISMRLTRAYMPRFDGPLYRAINPIWAKQPLSGDGAARFGGRFNAKGTPALYTALSPATAIRESNQVGHLQPTTIVSYIAEFASIFDARDHAAMTPYNIDLAAPTWRDEMRTSGISLTQRFAADRIADGFDGMLVPSFVRGAGGDDVNLVLWNWGSSAPSKLTLIDDENRLART